MDDDKDWVERIQDGIAELFGEILLAFLGFGVVALLAFAVKWGLDQHPRTTVSILVAVVLFLLYGLYWAVRSWRRMAMPKRRLAYAAVVFLGLAALLASYGIPYLADTIG